MAKLTLRLDDALTDRAKRYARRHDQSVSQLVANFFGPGGRPKWFAAGRSSGDDEGDPRSLLRRFTAVYRR
ncbi:MAG: DUF6364 family protein [Myxococcota bacterium]